MGFAEGFAMGSDVGRGALESFSAGFEGTRKLFVDAEYKKAAQATQAQLATQMAEFDNRAALNEAELAAFEEDAMADGEVDPRERNILKFRRTKIEQGRFSSMMDALAQVTAQQGNNPYIEPMIKPLFEQVTARYQQFYNQVAAEFEEHKLTTGADLEREGMAVQEGIASQQQQGENRRLGVRGDQEMNQIGARGAEERKTLGEQARLGIGAKGESAKGQTDPIAIHEAAVADVKDMHAADITGGKMPPERFQMLVRTQERELARRWSRIGAQAGPGLMDEPGSAGEEQDQEASDISELEGQREGLMQQKAAAEGVLDENRFMGVRVPEAGLTKKSRERNRKRKEKVDRAKGEIESYEDELQNVQDLLDDLRARAVGKARGTDAAARAKIRDRAKEQ